MAIVDSELESWAISRDEGETWDVLPGRVNDFDFEQMMDPLVYLSGEQQVGLLWKLNLRWEVLLRQDWFSLVALYRTNQQSLLLNYLSLDADLTGYPMVRKWKYAPAIWATPPVKNGGAKGLIYQQVSVVFSNVEWWLPSN